MMKGVKDGRGAVWRRAAFVALCLWDTAVPGIASPLLAQGGPAETQEHAPPTGSLMKYGPSYVLVVVLVGLGAFIASVPRISSLGQVPPEKDKAPAKKKQ